MCGARSGTPAVFLFLASATYPLQLWAKRVRFWTAAQANDPLIICMNYFCMKGLFANKINSHM